MGAMRRHIRGEKKLLLVGICGILCGRRQLHQSQLACTGSQGSDLACTGSGEAAKEGCVDLLSD